MTTDDKNAALARKIAVAVAEEGGAVYYVGGCVRDKLRHEEVKDVDIEVHGVYPDRLESILDSLGSRLTIGESFGIYNLKGYSLDIAMPRKETNRGSGHRDFDVCVDPFIGTYSAALRRDFTVNAIMEDVLTGRLTDHFDGVGDIKRGVIRHVNDATFCEDPLRVLRAAQFAARFGYIIADETLELCSGMDLSHLSRERVMGEVVKALLKADKPSVFFESLRRMGQLSFWFPELEAVIGVPQSPKHHAEGDVWTHTMMVVDAAAAFRGRVSDPAAFMLAAVVHDLGKAVCTEVTDGEIHSYDHETLGLPLAESFLKRLTAEKSLAEYALNLTELHMRPNMLAAQSSSVKATNRMFDLSVDPEALICLAVADGLGKISTDGPVSNEAFLLDRLATYREYMSRPYVMGRDLIEAGVSPSERFSEYLAYAHKLRLAGVDKESALRQTLALARKDK